jgi:hypothetical protein
MENIAINIGIYDGYDTIDIESDIPIANEIFETIAIIRKKFCDADYFSTSQVIMLGLLFSAIIFVPILSEWYYHRC